MTPQHRLAIEIMSECGMSAHEIVDSFVNEAVHVDLDFVRLLAGELSNEDVIDITRPFQEAA